MSRHSLTSGVGDPVLLIRSGFLCREGLSGNLFLEIEEADREGAEEVGEPSIPAEGESN